MRNNAPAWKRRRREGLFDIEDRINLSACLIRMGEYAAAQQMLEAELRRVPRDSTFRFLLLLNLAAACQEDEGLLQRGAGDAAGSSGKLAGPGAGLESGGGLVVSPRRRVFSCLDTAAEPRTGGAAWRPTGPRSVAARSALSQGRTNPVEEGQFIGANGEYEAGGIAWKQWDRLPADADSVVLQLLLWRPRDLRLFWLYGELLNARGLVDSAYDVLSRVRMNDQWRNQELDRHVRVLADALGPYRELFVDSVGTGETRRKLAMLLWSLCCAARCWRRQWVRPPTRLAALPHQPTPAL